MIAQPPQLNHGKTPQIATRPPPQMPEKETVACSQFTAMTRGMIGSPRLRGAGVSTSSMDFPYDGGASATAWNNWGSSHDSLNHASASHSHTSCVASAGSPQAVHDGESKRPAACNLAAGHNPPRTKLRKHAASNTGELRNTDKTEAKKVSAGRLGLPMPASRHNATWASLLASHRISVGQVEETLARRPRKVRKTL